MANPFDQFDAAASPAPSASSSNPFDQFDAAPTQQATAAPLTQDQVNDHILKLINDPKVSGQQIREFYTSMGGKLNEHDSGVLDQRDIYIRANHKAPTVGLDTAHATASETPGLTDNRPYDFTEGVRQGDQHVLSNVAGGAGWLADKLGIQNSWGDYTRQHFANLEAAEPTQGSGLGKLTGEVIASSPAALAAVPITAGATAVGAPTAVAAGLGMFADGALQGALTTHSDAPGGVLRDAAIGGTAGVVLGGAANGLGRLASTPTRAAQQGREVLDAANRLSRDGLTVAPLPGDTGGALARGFSAAAEAGIVSNGPYRRGVDRLLDSAQAVRDRAANALAPGNTARDLDAVAGDVQSGVGGLGDYEPRSAERVGRMYDNAADLTGDAQIATPTTLDALNRLIGEREAIPGTTPGLDALRALRDDLTPTPDQVIRPSLWDRIVNGHRTRTIEGDPAQYAIDSLRRLRTSFGDNFDSSQRAAREAANEIWGPLSEDIQTGLRNQGRGDAADAYRDADRAWAERATNLDEIVHPVLGSRNQGQLADHLVNLSQNDPDLLNRTLDLMAPDQAAQVRGGLVQNLGRSTSGAQNAAGDAFSLNSFLTDWDKMSDGAKQSILAGQSGDDLVDLARLAEAARVSGRYRNTSGTARSSDALAVIKGLASTLSGPGGGFALGGIPGALAGLGLQHGLGSVMASPTTARALVSLGEIRPATHSAEWLTLLARLAAPATNGEAQSPNSQ